MIGPPTRHSSTPATQTEALSRIRKAVLICPKCGHESLIDGDWRTAHVDVGTRHERRVYTCPECTHTVTVRPELDAVHRHNGP